MRTRVVVLVVILNTAGPVRAQEAVETSAGPLELAVMAEGLVEPWAIGFLPDGGS